MRARATSDEVCSELDLQNKIDIEVADESYSNIWHKLAYAPSVIAV